MGQTNSTYTRRSFLRSSLLAGGGFMISFTALQEPALAEGNPDSTVWSEITGYIKITPDNLVKILNPNPEFGQNVMTSLPMIVAEELDVNWDKVMVEMGPHDNVKLGPQFTGGSNSVRMYWRPLREAGAAARQMLREAAAQAWGVPIDEITTKEGLLLHEKSGRKATYGEMAAKAAVLPIPKGVKLKENGNFSIVNTPRKNVENARILTGKPLFGIDYTAEGMLIAMIYHPPAFGMKLKSFDATEALKMPGIKEVFRQELYADGFEQAGFDTRTFNDLLVIVGNTTWQVMNARKKIKVQWENAGDVKNIVAGRGSKQEVIFPGALESTATQMAAMKEYAAKPSQALRKDGDPDAQFTAAARIIERTYNAPFLAHNCMEPMNFFAHVMDDKAILAGPHQAPGWSEPTIAKLLGLPPEKIEMRMTRMGGGFGLRAYGHYQYEAALISKRMKAPVKLIYTREDDMTYGIYRPMYTATYKAALDANKKLIAIAVKGGGIPENPIHANRFPAGAVDHYKAEGWQIPSNVTIGAFRAPRSNFNAAAEQSFMDELAEAMGKDPIELRLEMLQRAKDNPVGRNNEYDADRYAGVLKLVREKSGWGKPENNKYFRGVAAYFCHASYAAHVVDIVMKNGKPVVERVFSAIDCGVVVNPDAATNMVEGAVVDAIGNALYGKLTMKNGVPDQNNFHQYKMIRQADAPKSIEVHFVKNNIDPTGLGEPPFPPVFAAVANALYKATKKRYYNQPFLNQA